MTFISPIVGKRPSKFSVRTTPLTHRWHICVQEQRTSTLGARFLPSICLLISTMCHFDVSDRFVGASWCIHVVDSHSHGAPCPLQEALMEEGRRIPDTQSHAPCAP